MEKPLVEAVRGPKGTLSWGEDTMGVFPKCYVNHCVRCAARGQTEEDAIRTE